MSKADTDNMERIAPTPWAADTRFGESRIADARGAVVATCCWGTTERSSLLRDHIPACVNGCKGLNPYAYQEVLGALEELLDVWGKMPGTAGVGDTDEARAIAHAGRRAKVAAVKARE